MTPKSSRAGLRIPLPSVVRKPVSSSKFTSGGMGMARALLAISYTISRDFLMISTLADLLHPQTVRKYVKKQGDSSHKAHPVRIPLRCAARCCIGTFFRAATGNRLSGASGMGSKAEETPIGLPTSSRLPIPHAISRHFDDFDRRCLGPSSSTNSASTCRNRSDPRRKAHRGESRCNALPHGCVVTFC
jgi:hypothetical protein